MGESLLDVKERTREQRAALHYLECAGFEVLEPDGYESQKASTVAIS